MTKHQKKKKITVQGEGIYEAILDTGKCSLMNTVLGSLQGNLESFPYVKNVSGSQTGEQDEDLISV